ncbi:tetratricopeptide repeat protein [Kordia sp.]|uniref:tetratricopeptide repeat protein n=1 Tax=Kordia sp. TaxID=1965332 RepID=UPI0025C0784E|nr:tetratricopeptide repeat protein [Kordia sp.]MCH2195021.1 hypothetical protein [Kordia sp.]
MKLKLTFFIVVFLISTQNYAQTFTMGKKCRSSLETAQSTLKSGMYEDALAIFETFSSKCRTKDAKEAAAVGKAQAYNGLERYQEAITEADKALKITKNKSLNGHFQKAVAQSKIGNIAGYKASIEKVIELTEKNQNTAERASNYALMAALYERQLNDITTAQEYLNKAKAMDPNSVKYLVQEGTMYSTLKQFDKAFQSYDVAKRLDPNNKELAIARANTRLRMLEAKYGTKRAQELRSKMTPSEKEMVCEDLNTSKRLGANNMNKDMFLALVCN